MKNKNLNVRLTDETLATIKEMAEFHNISQSELITILIELADQSKITQYLLDQLTKK